MTMKKIENSESLVGDKQMDDFILEIRNNLNKSHTDMQEVISGDSNHKMVRNSKEGTSRFREIISIIASIKPEIKIIGGCTPEGDIRFEVPLKFLGLTPDTYKKYRLELSTDFIANFLGEILVRENLDLFVKLLVNLKENYGITVNKFRHREFGMIITKEKCIFALHSSLIQSILTEDIRDLLK